MSNIKSFGEVQIETKPCDIVLSRKKTTQAQIMVPNVQTRSIENIKLEMHKTAVATEGTYVYGCCLIPDGRMAFTYYYNCAVGVFSDKGSKDFEVKMPCIVYDILYISKDDTFAVTSGCSSQHRIFIINVERKQITRTISLDSEIYGIALSENGIIYSGYNKGIRMINLSDESITQIVQDEMPRCCNIATFRNQIYHTNPETHGVTCYDLQGKPQWTFKNGSLLKGPRGIDVDMDGNVYVVGSRSNNVVVISLDGQRYREVLAASDGLDLPTSLCFNNSKKQLLVTNYNNEARLYALI
ncbi:unnamed protein product [Mytilus edulis]|uniref:Uncharacterized protein n=1 Tax=Mytilus edulis TaxID=6550 RepID=A0A8S3SCZ7_MYTED|nr:unnamed protein product [Mytilus edulis]